MHAKCRAVKTITIDLEAYEALAARKRTFAEERHTAKHVLESLPQISLSEEALDRIEDVRMGG